MRIKAKNPKLVSAIGEFMKVYLPCVRNRDDDTIDSYRYSLNLYMTEYSCAVKPPIRQAGNRLSGPAGTAYTSLLA